MLLEKLRKQINLPFRVCLIILLMLIAQGFIVELFLFNIINHILSRVPAKLLPKVSGILLQFNHYYLPIFFLTSFIFAMGIFIFVKRLTAPLERLMDLSAKIASGDYEKRIILRKNDDLYEIAENINKLAIKLEDLRKNIHEISGDLEQYSKIGSHISNIINELKGLSEEQERSLREDGKKIAILCEEIEEKNRILTKALNKKNESSP